MPERSELFKTDRQSERERQQRRAGPGYFETRPEIEQYVPPAPSILDKLLAGQLTSAQVAEAIISDGYGPLQQFCALPLGFSGRELGYEHKGIATMTGPEIDSLNRKPPSKIIDPKPPQIEAVELLQMYLRGDPHVCNNGDPYKPMFGVNFVGKPGCGKTHIMSAFAKQMKKFLDEKLEHYHQMVRDFVRKEYLEYQKATVVRGDASNDSPRYVMDTNPTNPGITEEKAPTVVFAEKLKALQLALAKLEYQPPDLLYLDFEQLCELCGGDAQKREEVLGAIIRAKVLFLDDVHPKKDTERAQLVSHVIEGRYAAGRMGTFMTTNLSTQELAGGDSEHIFERLQSRCNEMLYPVDFADCVDWRTAIKQRRITIVRQYLAKKVLDTMGLEEPCGNGLDI